ncbi:dehydrogenase/reductase SDR family member 4-like [Acanthaster planci]|uniref:Dehydrogenase/reductase SDR family member 4-like n=1 Tax=Acanthaster planci TaxID=133434 RepID=A0A8B7YMS1_ACAPL|nr:dehydrogenase/reductase SDR family member 4-like [Acanthaster planci]
MSLASHHLWAFLRSGFLTKLAPGGQYQSLAVRMASAAACKRLVGKVAIVTASTDGIGFAIAKRLGSEGAHVVISSRKQDNVDRAIKELKDENLSVTGMVCHVGKAEHRAKLINETVAKHGGIDILVSNAAVNPAFGPMLNTTEEQWDKIFDVNVKSTFLLIKECVPHMVDRKGSSIVIVSSVGGYNPFSLLGCYSISKTTLLGMTRALASECGPMGIRVNCIAPGIIKTRFSEALWSDKSVLDLSLLTATIKRPGESDECAGAVAFLCSDDASYITGENILITGGMHARL